MGMDAGPGAALIRAREVLVGLTGAAVWAVISYHAEGTADISGAIVFATAFTATLVIWNYLRTR